MERPGVYGLKQVTLKLYSKRDLSVSTAYFLRTAPLVPLAAVTTTIRVGLA